MSDEETSQARILGQIERMAAAEETPTSDIHAWLETVLATDPDLDARLSPPARAWLELYGLR